MVINSIKWLLKVDKDSISDFMLNKYKHDKLNVPAENLNGENI